MLLVHKGSDAVTSWGVGVGGRCGVGRNSREASLTHVLGIDKLSACGV